MMRVLRAAFPILGIRVETGIVLDDALTDEQALHVLTQLTPEACDADRRAWLGLVVA